MIPSTRRAACGAMVRERAAMVFWKSRWELADMCTPDVLVKEFKA
jgi:hypothetical protein